MNKKNNTIIIIIAIIILAVIALITLKVRNQNQEPAPQTQTEIDLNQAIKADSTTDINASLDEIDLTDTSDADLTNVDQELENL